jgi:hypothetical protein
MTTKKCTVCNEVKGEECFENRMLKCKTCAYKGKTVSVDTECNKCKVVKQPQMFAKGKKICKACIGEQVKLRKENKKNDLSRKTQVKQCSLCQESKILTEFRVSGGSMCITCDNKVKVEKVRDYRSNVSSGKFEEEIRECRNCNKNLPVSMYRLNTLMCKDCDREGGRSYRKNNPEKALDWVKNNREKMSDIQANWSRSNKENINYKLRTRAKVDKRVAELNLYRRRLVNSFMLGKDCSDLDAESLIFGKWIQKNMDITMTKDNHGEWCFDHIIPIFYISLNYSIKTSVLGWFNITPVVTKHNLQKNKYITPIQAEEHLGKLIRFIAEEEIEIDFNIQTYINLLTEIKNTGKLECLPETMMCCMCGETKSMGECRFYRGICIVCDNISKREKNDLPKSSETTPDFIVLD